MIERITGCYVNNYGNFVEQNNGREYATTTKWCQSLTGMVGD